MKKYILSLILNTFDNIFLQKENHGFEKNTFYLQIL